MIIAMVANWWYRRGGLGAVMLDEASALERRGHSVVPFAAAHPANLDTVSASSFPTFVETADAGRGMSVGARLRAFRRLVHNGDAAVRFDRFIERFKPDLVHVHNTVRQLSPSILAAAKRHDLPVVMTMHDYGLMCPQGLLLRGGSQPCQPALCAHGAAIAAVRHRCVKDSVAASAAAALETTAHRWTGAYRSHVDTLIAPSRFIERLMVTEGRWPGPIRHLPNGIADVTDYAASPSAGRSVVFAGRLVREKGVNVLVEAARRCPSVEVVIAGDGPELHRLRELAPPNVAFVGQRSGDEIRELLSRARAAVVPSVWFENAPLSILEAMRAGRPVIATDLGGSRELLSGEAGILVRAGDATALAAAMRAVWDEPALADSIGARARTSFLERYTLDRHVDELLLIYTSVLGPTAPTSASAAALPSVPR
jgi:glycosyltransferase involved in cell wall biosynthesis